MSGRKWFALGAIIAAVGVGLGAFGAHGLEKHLVDRGAAADKLPKLLENHETAVRYQMIHAIAITLVGLASRSWPARYTGVAGVCFVFGVAGFSGGLYAIVYGVPLHWAIVPSGGALLILGWVVLAGSVIMAEFPGSPTAE